MNDIAAILRTERDAWSVWTAEQVETRTYGTALTGTPFVVATPCAGMALRVQGNTAVPVKIRPGLCGISHYDHATANRVAALRGDGYQVMAAADVAAVRMAAIDSMLAELARVSA